MDNTLVLAKCLHCNGFGVIVDNGVAVRVECFDCGSSTRWFSYDESSMYRSRPLAMWDACIAWNKKYIPTDVALQGETNYDTKC